MKKVVVSAFLLIFLSFFLVNSIEYKTVDTDTLLKQKATPKFLQKQIDQALQKDDIQSAKEFVNLAKYLDITLPETTLKKIEQKDTISKKLTDFGKGFFYGTVSSPLELTGSITSDFTIIGDIRDIKSEGEKYLKNKPYNEFILGISIVGVALSASTYISLGTTSSLKVTTSLLKTAKKSKSLTKGFTKTITKKLDKTYDKRLFKEMDFTDINSIKRALKSVDIKPVEKLLQKLSKITHNTSVYDTMYILKYIDSEKDLNKVLKLSQKYKKNTKAVLKVVGKSALRGAKQSLVLTTKLIVITVILLLFI